MTQKNFIFYSTVSKPTAPVKTQEELNKEQMAEFIKTFREEDDSDSDDELSDVEDSPTTSTYNFEDMFSDSDDDDDDDYQLETPPQSESDTEDIYTPPVSDNEEEEEVKFINPFDDPLLFTAEINKDNTYNPFDEFDVKPVSPPPLKIPEEKPRGRLALIREKKINKVSSPPLDLYHPKNIIKSINEDLLIKKINKNSSKLNRLYGKHDNRPGKSDKTRTCRMIRQILQSPDKMTGEDIYNLKRFYEEQEDRIKSYENDGEELKRFHKRDIKNDKRNKSYEYIIPLKDYELWIQDSSY